MITPRHVDVMAKIILMTGSIVGYAYIMEFFIAWYSGNMYEDRAFLRSRVAGPVTDLVIQIVAERSHAAVRPYWWAYYCMMSFNVLSPQFSGSEDAAAASGWCSGLACSSTRACGSSASSSS